MGVSTIDIKARFQQLCKLFGVRDWDIVVADMQRYDGDTDEYSTLGLCVYDLKLVVIDRDYAEHGDQDAVLETVDHEFAHVLAGYDAGHGPQWIWIAEQLGVNTEVYRRAAKLVERFGLNEYEAVSMALEAASITT